MSKVILVQILIIVGMTLFLFFMEWKAKKYAQAFCFAAAAVLLGALSSMVISKIPMGTDNVKITVLDEKNENAKSQEAFLREIRIDGKTYEISKPVEGKWFWRGERYGYRPDSDERRPDGLTKSITLEIPKGDSRKLIFTANEYAGIVRVEAMGEEIRQDLYVEEGQNMTVNIAGTPLNELRVMKLLRCIFFVALYIVLLFGFWILLRFVEKNQKSVFGVLGKNWDYIVYAALAVWVLVGLMLNITKDSLWYDEVWNVGWYASGDKIYNQYSHHFLMRNWYRLMPFGEQYLLFLTEFITAVSVFLTGIAGKLYGGKRVGVFSATVIASIPYFYRQVGSEYRNYYLLYFAAVVAFIAYMKRGNGRDVRIGRILIYSLCLTLTMDAHQYGMLVAASFLGMDFLMMLFKRIPWKNLLSFLFPVAYVVFWISTNDMGGLWNNYSWTSTPNAVTVYNTVYLLCGESLWLVGLLVLGIVYAVWEYLGGIVHSRKGAEEELYKVMPILVTGGVFAASIVYSVWVNPENSLYVERYFVCILVYLVILIASAFELLWKQLEAVLAGVNREKAVRILVTGMVCAVLLNGSMQYFCSPVTHKQPYREAVKWASEQNDIYKKDTLVAVAGNKYLAAGWGYYFSKKGERDLPNLCSVYSLPDLSQYSKIYVNALHLGLADGPSKQLEQQFERTEEIAQYNMYVYERKQD